MAGTQPRSLVIVRAGDRSLHPAWTANRDTRAWDLVVSYFGSDPARYRSDGDRRIDDRGQKWTGLHALLSREDFWRRYDYVWLPDDDLAADEHAIDALFTGMDRWQLALAQPALSWQSHYSHPITLRHPSFRIRFTNFVEIMAPCFARHFLERCLPTFTESLSGWGLDYVWPHLLPDAANRVAIIDEVTVTHTRPVGGPSYDLLRGLGISAAEESARTKRKHGVADDTTPSVRGGIDVGGRALDAADARTGAQLRSLEASDRVRYGLAMLARRPPHTRAVTFDPAQRAFTWRE